MKKLIVLFKLIMSYIIGNILFNLVFSITEIIIADIFALKLDFLGIYIKNTINNLTLYTSIFLIIIILTHTTNLYIVKKLNEKMKRYKKRTLFSRFFYFYSFSSKLRDSHELQIL